MAIAPESTYGTPGELSTSPATRSNLTLNEN